MLNEVTNTVHKRAPDGGEFQSECGVTDNVSHGDLRRVPVERVVDAANASKCGRCFGGAGGY